MSTTANTPDTQHSSAIGPSTTHRSVQDPTAALMNDIARLSIDYAEARWQRMLLSAELKARAAVRIAWFSLLALPPGTLAVYLGSHALAQQIIVWGLRPPAAYGLVALLMAVLCIGAVLVAKRTTERWFQ